MRDIHCESVCHAGRAAVEEKATGMAQASAGDFSRSLVKSQVVMVIRSCQENERDRGTTLICGSRRRNVQFKGG
jgi:hypothetical protein